MAIYTHNGKLLADGANGLATSSACCCGNEQWKKCADDTNAAVLSEAHVLVDYAWLCLSSTWVKCYNDSATGTSATDPSAVEQCDNAAPASCSDLVGIPRSDAFDGGDCDSTAVSDTNWTLKNWVQDTATNTTQSISGNKYVLVHSTEAAVYRAFGIKQALSRTGDFYIKAIYSNLVLYDDYRDNGFAILRVVVGGTTYGAGMTMNDIGADGGFYDNGGSFSTADGNYATSGHFILQRVSGTISFIVNGSTLWTTSNSGTLTEFQMRLESFTQDQSNGVDYDSIEVLDGVGGNLIYRDFSGDACT